MNRKLFKFSLILAIFIVCSYSFWAEAQVKRTEPKPPPGPGPPGPGPWGLGPSGPGPWGLGPLDPDITTDIIKNAPQVDSGSGSGPPPPDKKLPTGPPFPTPVEQFNQQEYLKDLKNSLKLSNQFYHESTKFLTIYYTHNDFKSLQEYLDQLIRENAKKAYEEFIKATAQFALEKLELPLSAPLQPFYWASPEEKEQIRGEVRRMDQQARSEANSQVNSADVFTGRNESHINISTGTAYREAKTIDRTRIWSGQ